MSKKSFDWKKEIKENQGYRCAMCGKKFREKELQIHHCRNRSKGGESSKENCCAVCLECHRNIHKIHGNNYFDPRKL
mgnify:CR=1 FL=1